MVSDERAGSRASINWLKDGRFNFQEVLAVQESTNRTRDGGPGYKNLADLRIDRQVSVALAIARLQGR